MSVKELLNHKLKSVIVDEEDVSQSASSDGIRTGDLKKGKNIVLCFDGTHNKFGPSPYTNLLKLFRMLEKDDPESQICYYQPGIGASMSVESESMFERYLSKQSLSDNLDSLIAFSLDQHIIDAYKYLMRFYQNGDKIYLFGFSRGAFIARVLSSMIDRVGLLNAGLEEMAESAWSIYSAWEYAAQPSQPDYTTTLIDEYKKTFSRVDTPRIEFVGMFDCVNSVGLLRDRLFPLSTKSGLIKNLSHAVSLDERRGKYRQNLIFPFSYKPSFFSLTSTEQSSGNSSRKVTNAGSSTKTSVSSSISSILLEHFGEKSQKKLNDAQKLMKDIEQKLKETSRMSIRSRLKRVETNNNNTNGTDHQASFSTFGSSSDKQKLITGEYKEVWFAGNHGDIGGGWASDVNGHFLSHIPLRWMFGEALRVGVIFQRERLVNFANRFSSLDSMLSCNHDMLSFYKGELTHEISQAERETVLELSKATFNKAYIPDFRSCEVISDQASFEQFSPIQGYDGRGNSSIWNVLGWWIVEFLPIGTKIEDEDDKWRNVYVPNLGRPRSVPQYSKLHWSVYWRMKLCYDYLPRNLPEYVENILNERRSNHNDSESRDELMEFDVSSAFDDHTSDLIKKLIMETRLLFKQWDSEHWKQVPDDLNPIMRELGYM
ncbi:hypothetical protein WICANDRAFT_34864 [Wickerhamomyces anomalus NRRL Y-366-8]|uniref:T6SS Phospholipase effector Tle1-like catalytic domain-containing protein n=1 Tax=Wickerhamomyces anomalus (strain ATCC 58044 / CBS 1984 / NCYC 433 / NRRL Y-366-8) TaxID=683960 RepID=A0A1E3NX51_WICAA|nr:uncharacterized protein WICANDRAFT_34864 [Wickerhamomyces anomalus NRRL Y-366-8]ODQ57728.1 hypothetical protein WICANDRAFT_34864 [Wickerhamomyces anomalus NRRL Y-366-8]